VVEEEEEEEEEEKGSPRSGERDYNNLGKQKKDLIEDQGQPEL